MLDQRRRRSADAVQMLYKCIVFAGMTLEYTYYYYDYSPRVFFTIITHPSITIIFCRYFVKLYIFHIHM